MKESNFRKILKKIKWALQLTQQSDLRVSRPQYKEELMQNLVDSPGEEAELGVWRDKSC